MSHLRIDYISIARAYSFWIHSDCMLNNRLWQNVFGNVSNIVWYHLVGDLLHAKLVENNPTLPTILICI